MKKVLTKIQNVEILNFIKNDNQQYLFINLKDKIKAFTQNSNDLNLEFYKEYNIDDEILNYHIYQKYVLLIGKSNKKIVLFDQAGDKLKEL